MKHFFSCVLLCCGIGVTPRIAYAATSAPLLPENDKEERAYAPKDGFYLVETPEDCKLGGRYIFASSVFSLQDYILTQNMEAARYIEKHASNIFPKPAHIVNGSVIYDDNVALKYAIWRYEEGKNKANNLLNIDSNELMAVWQYFKVSTNDQYNLFTVQKSKVSKEMSTSMSFKATKPKPYNEKTCESPKWFGLFFYDKKVSDWINWSNTANAFKVYTELHTEEHIEKRAFLINPTRIFRHFTKDELLPTTYVATKTIYFTSAGYRTFYSQHAYTIPEGVKAYYAQIDGNNLNLYPIQNAIPACTAVLLYKEQAGEVKLNLTFDEVAPLKDDNSLKGTRHELSEQEVDESRFNYYGLTVDEDKPNDWYFARIESSIPVGKAVLAFNKSTTPNKANARKLDFVVHNARPTAIVPPTSPTLAPGSSQPTMTIWDLQGRPLQHPTHGQPYIQNGKVRIGE